MSRYCVQHLYASPAELHTTESRESSNNLCDVVCPSRFATEVLAAVRPFLHAYARAHGLGAHMERVDEFFGELQRQVSLGHCSAAHSVSVRAKWQCAEWQ